MGCESSKAERVPQMKFKAPTEPNFGRKEGLNPKDYIFSRKKDETLLKNPGQIDGQQFIIEECESCDIFLLDHVGTLTVDMCKDSRIVVGPVSSSVFIRNCKDCIVIVACQQLRLRDCLNLSILLCSYTGPIIELSRNIGIGCFTYNYFGMEEHFRAASLNPWVNCWWDVYDFTPGPSNFQLLPTSPTAYKTLVPASAQLIEEGLAPADGTPPFVPLTYGTCQPRDITGVGTEDWEPILLLVSPEAQGECRTLLDNVSAISTYTTDFSPIPAALLRRTNLRSFALNQVSTLLDGEQAARGALRGMGLGDKGPVSLLVLDLLLRHPASQSLLSGLAESEALTGKHLLWRGSAAKEKIELIFEAWKVKT